MRNLKDYAKMILSPKPEIIYKTEELKDYITEVATDIYNDPVRNRSKRRYPTVYDNTLSMISEFALQQRTNDLLIRNPLEWSYKIRESYAYDLIDTENGKTFECKQWAQNWYSYTHSAVETFKKNLDLVDYLICTKQVDMDTYYEVYFYMIANAKTFNLYEAHSGHKNEYGVDKFYYNHRAAYPKGDAIVQPNHYSEHDV